VTSVALHMPAWWGSEEGRYLLDVPRPVLFTVVVGIGVTASALFWGLHAGRPALLVRGVVIGMAIVWGASIWPLNKRRNEIWDFRQFAATVNRHARGGAVAIYQHRDKWGPIDFYLGRSPRSVFTIEQVIEHLTRGEGFVVLMDNVAWDVFGPQLSQDIRVLHRVTVGPQTLIVLGYGRWLSDGLADLGVLNHQSDAWPG
jgi:hypothetical protein